MNSSTDTQMLIDNARCSTFEYALKLAEPNIAPLSTQESEELLDTLRDSPAEWDESGDTLLNLLDRKLTECIDSSVSSVLHHPQIAGLRRRWSSVEQLFAEPGIPEDFRVKILQATPSKLNSQLRNAGGNIENTPIYKHLSLASFGSIPYLVVEFDHTLGGTKQDLDLLHFAGRLGEKGLFVNLMNVGPDFFGLEEFNELPTDSKSLKGLFTSKRMGPYVKFRKESYSRFVAPCFPAAYTVTPFSPDNNPSEGFEDFTEDIRDESDLVTVGAAAKMLQCIVRSVGTTGWPAAIVGEDFGGKIDGMFVRDFSTATGEERANVSTQVTIPETIEIPLTENGLTALVAKLNSTIAAFFAGATASSVVSGLDPKKSQESAMAASLPNMLVTLRFSHYLRALHRKLIGSQKTPKEIEAGLQAWANRFVLDQDDASDKAKNERPFRSITVKVQPNADKPGYLSAEVKVVPHYRVCAVQGEITILANPQSDSDN